MAEAPEVADQSVPCETEAALLASGRAIARAKRVLARAERVRGGHGRVRGGIGGVEGGSGGYGSCHPDRSSSACMHIDGLGGAGGAAGSGGPVGAARLHVVEGVVPGVQQLVGAGARCWIPR